MQYKILTIALLATVFIIFTQCKKDESTGTGTGSVTIELENRAGNQTLALGKNYVTGAGDTVNFTTFNYFISNLVFVKADGSTYTVPKDQSYFLCKHDQSTSRVLTISNVPVGEYTALKFIIGVDSLKSVSDISQRTGVLDPTAGASGMYWAWNSGYIFVKVEGTSPQAPLNAQTGKRTIEYHTGLFGGKDTRTINNLKNVTLSATGAVAKVQANTEGSHYHVFVDVLEMFIAPKVIRVKDRPASHAEATSKDIADNYADMFKLDHIHNN